jgi:hypothetical protein
VQLKEDDRDKTIETLEDCSPTGRSTSLILTNKFPPASTQQEASRTKHAATSGDIAGLALTGAGAHRALHIKEHQMRIAKQLGFTFFAACAFSAVAVSSAWASPTFLSHPLGLLLASAGTSIQKFTVGAGEIECKSLKLLPPGDATTALRALSLLVVVDYENCTLLGILRTVIHPVKYLIDANGLVRLENDVLILAEEDCLITVPAASNQSLWTVKFDNNSVNHGILLLVNIGKITSSGIGGPINACVYPTESAGTYTGQIHVTLDSTAGIPNTLRWDP